MTSTLAQNLNQVQQRIKAAAEQNMREASEITLVAVSKRHSASAIQNAFDLGQRDFGENYLQEAIDKIEQLQLDGAYWHFIGPIQSNKTRAIAENFAWAHTIDRLKIAQRLSDQRPPELPNLNVCVQVNIDKEASKSGVLPDEAHDLVKQITTLPKLNLRGLMAIPKKNPDDLGEPFKNMHALFRTIEQKLNLPMWDTLSMGMSGDLELAIQHHTTMVRVGTDIFGERN